MSSSIASTLRPLGTTGLHVHPLCLGGNVFGWTAGEEESFAVLDAYVAAGGNFIDTADVYSAWVDGHAGGESERVIGKWLAARPGVRERIVLATKVGMLGDGGLSPEAIETGIAGSLDRLGVDTVDLYYAHRDLPGTQLEATLEAFDELVRDGRVRALGASNFTAERLAEALSISDANGLARFAVLQPGLSAVDRADYPPELAALCEREQIAVAPYAVLASGFLTGKYTRDSALESQRADAVSAYVGEDAAWKTLDAIREVAKERATSPSAIAVAWAKAQPGVVAPITSARTVAQLPDLLEGAAIDLGADELGRIG